MLDYSEPSSRVFLFDNILFLVVPTAAICSSKRMIPLETIKRDMTTLGIITKIFLALSNIGPLNRGTKRTRCVPFFHTAMHKCHVPFCLYFVNIVILCTFPCCAFRICITHGFCFDPLSLENQRRVRATFLNTYVGHFATPRRCI